MSAIGKAFLVDGAIFLVLSLFIEKASLLLRIAVVIILITCVVLVIYFTILRLLWASTRRPQFILAGCIFISGTLLIILIMFIRVCFFNVFGPI